MKKVKDAKIKFIADECVANKYIVFLRSLGYAVSSVWDLKLTGASNGTLIRLAAKDGKVFLTEDRDFCNILLYSPHLYRGIVVLKASPENEEQIKAVLNKLLSELSAEDFDKSLIIVDKNQYRLRK